MLKVVVPFLFVWSSAFAASTGIATLQKADQLADLYNWSAAGPFYQQAETAFRRAHDARNALYAHLGYIRATFESRSFSETATYLSQTCEQSNVQGDLPLLLKCLVAKGDTDGEIDSAPAEADWQQVLKVATKLHDARWTARATGEIGFHRWVQGDHSTAKKNTSIALLQAEKLGDYAAVIRFESGIGTALVYGGFADMGLGYLNKAWELALTHPEVGYPYMTAAGKTMALLSQGHLPQAELLASDQSRHALVDHRFVKYTQAELFRADVAISQKDQEHAKQILLATLEVAAHNNTRLLRDVYSKLSNLYRVGGDLRAAARYAHAAYVACQDSHEMYLAPSVLLTTAKLDIEQHQYAAASRVLQKATDMVEGMLVHTTEVSARESMLATMSEVYRTHFELAARHKDVAKAFRIIEQVRGRLVSELLVNKRDVMDRSELNSGLEDSIRALKLRLVKAKADSEVKAVSDQLFFVEQARWVRDKNRQLRGATPITLERFRASLPTGQAFLEYVLGDGDRSSYCLIVSAAETRIVQLASGNELQKSAKEFLDDVAQNRSTLSSTHLFDAVVRPLNLDRYSAVEISPDGVLNSIPFEALRSGPGSSKYWGITTTISYVPSAEIETLLAKKSEIKRSFVGIGGVPYDANRLSSPDRVRGTSERYGDLSKVHDLPSSEEEVRSAATLIGDSSSKLILNRDTTKANVILSDVGQYGVIHFAVHARANVADPDLSYLLLKSDPNQDGFLETRDIMQQRIQDSLVVLSACDTAIGHVQGEEGVASLGRSFVIAGASSVISTLWQVDDTYSLFMMKQFYEHFGRGESASESLRSAKVAVLEKFGKDTPPKVWAGWVLTGNGRVKLAGPVEHAQLR